MQTPEEVKYIQDALVFVSEEGWKFLPEYVFYEDTGEWRHKSMKNKKPFRRWLNDVSQRCSFPLTQLPRRTLRVPAQGARAPRLQGGLRLPDRALRALHGAGAPDARGD